MSEELKPCPFCNAQIAFEANEYGGDHYHPHNDCWLTGTLISGSWVSSPKWNRRASPTPEGRGGEDAHEAAKRIVEFDPIHGDGWSDALAEDAVKVARALLSSPRVEEVRREALEKAAEQFEFYGREHREKAHASRGNGLTAAADAADGKALTNETFGALCRVALSPPVGKDTK